jgi:hypothetical protein
MHPGRAHVSGATTSTRADGQALQCAASFVPYIARGTQARVWRCSGSIKTAGMGHTRQCVGDTPFATTLNYPTS